MRSGQYVSLGWHTVVPSALTGQELKYFTPARLSQLVPYLKHSSADVEPKAWYSETIVAALIYGAQLRDRQQVAPSNLPALSENFAKLLIRDNDKAAANLLRSAAAVAGIRWQPFRQQIVYAGPVAKYDTPLYALEDAIPEGIGDIDSVLTGADKTDAFELAATAAYVLLCLHPFIDGNGRLARALVLLITSVRGRPLMGALVSAVMRWQPGWFVKHCMKSRNFGLMHYLDGMHLGADACRSRLFDSSILRLGEELATLIERSSQRQAMLNQLVRMLICGVGFESKVREELRMSSKISALVFDGIAGAHPDVGRINGSVDFSGLYRAVAGDISNLNIRDQ